jgi:hypothetical protein
MGCGYCCFILLFDYPIGFEFTCLRRIFVENTNVAVAQSEAAEVTAACETRKGAYKSPELTEFGSVADLVLGGTNFGDDGGGVFTLT